MSLLSNTGIQPLITVVLPWGSYTHKDTIRSISNPTRQSTALGSVTTIQVTMDDTNGVFKSKLDTVALLGQPASVVLSYIDDTPSITILEGVITSDIVWSEGERSFSFAIESRPSSGNIGYAAGIIGTGTTPNGYGWDEGWTIPNWPYDAGGTYVLGKLNSSNATKPWPVVFGQALKVPALRMTDLDIGTLAIDIDETTTSIEISGGQKFKQNEFMTIGIGDFFYYGKFINSKTFTVTTANVAVQWNPTLFTGNFVARDTKDLNDLVDASVAWIEDPINYTNKFVYVECISGPDLGKTFANFVITQRGRKLYFAAPCPGLIDEKYKVNSFAGGLKGTWEDEFGVTYNTFFVQNGADLGRALIKDAWRIKKGAEVYHAGSQAQYYILDYHSGSEVKCLYAYRTYKGARMLTPIPSSYYVLDNASQPDGEHQVTAAIFPVMLSRYVNEGWEDQVYADISSTGSANLAEAIEEILTEFTDLTADPTTFAAVTTKVAPFPIGFAFTEQKDALQAVQEMAWQGRCSLYREGSTVYITYLSETRSEQAEFSENEVLMNSMTQSLTTIEDIGTIFKANWREHGAEDGARQYSYVRNIDEYGVHFKEFDFYIYNHAQLVQQSTDFWGYRYSNIWRNITFAIPMVDYDLIPEDQIGMALSDYVGGISFVKTFGYNLQDYTIGISAESACKMGSASTDSGYYLGDPGSPVDPGITVPNKLLDVQEKDYDVLANVKDPDVNPYSVRVINKTGAIIEPYTVWKKMGKDANGVVQLAKMEQTDDLDACIDYKRLVVMYTKLEIDAVGFGISAERPEHLIKYTGAEPKKNALLGPTKDSAGKLVASTGIQRVKAFSVISVEEDKGADKMVRVRGYNGRVTDITLLQNSDSDIEVNGSFQIPQAKYLDFAVNVLRLAGNTKTGSATVQLMVEESGTFNLKGSALTVTASTTPVVGADFSPIVVIKAKQRFTFKVTGQSSPKMLECHAQVEERLEEEAVP